VTINDITGTATEISLMQTVLVTDEGRRVFVPNSQMASSIITNRSINDPRRSVSVQLPIALTTPVEEARAAVLAAVEGFHGASAADVTVLLTDVTEKTAWLTLQVRLPPESDVASVAAGLRERALGALAGAQLLPA
jgi:small conductance mechanosensitive channel